jgi:hypothetical protein
LADTVEKNQNELMINFFAMQTGRLFLPFDFSVRAA